MRFFKRFLTASWLHCTLLALLLLTGSLVDHPLLRQLDFPLYDQLMALRSTTLNPQVVLLTVDQRSRSELGDNVFSRSQQALILEKLQELGVQRIALLTPLNFSSEPTADQALAGQLAALKPVLAVEPLQSTTLKAGLPESALIPRANTLPAAKQLLLAWQNPLARYRFNQPADSPFLPPAEPFQRFALPLGHLLFSADCDGQIRRYPLLVPSEERLLPALPLVLTLRQRATPATALNLPPAGLPGKLQVADWQTPIDRDYQLLLDISGHTRPYLQYGVNQLLSGELDNRKLSERLVLLGSSESFADRQPLANRGPVSTSELAALATATLLSDGSPSRPAWGWKIETLVLMYFFILLLLLVPRLSTRAGILTLGLFSITWLLAAVASLVIFGYWLQVSPALILCLCGFVLVRWSVVQRNTRRSLFDTHRQLALTYQEQGRFDQALEKFLQFEPKDSASKEMLYKLGLDFERKRMPHKALTAYRHLLANGRFRDAKDRARQLQPDGRTAPRTNGQDATLVLDRPGEKPTLGRYRIEKELGQGAMGTVYLGVDPKINRQVAIKTLAYQQVDPGQLTTVKERFFREAEAAGRLSHPKIVTIYDVGEENDLAYLAMELLDGNDLSQYCQPKKLLPPLRAVQILKQIAQALDYAHQQGIVHRDIKPANIIVLQDGQIKVTDFGVARVMSSSQTETGLILGTPSYMSPEQVVGKKVDGRSDLFSLGVVMYELLSGEKPFHGENMAALMFNIANCNYQPLGEIKPELPAECQNIVERLLLKGVTRRIKSAGLLAEELEFLQQKLENG